MNLKKLVIIMTVKDFKFVTIGGVKFTQHHVVIFSLTFIRYLLLH